MYFCLPEAGERPSECQPWVNVSSKHNFYVAKVTKLHWSGDKGWTDKYPDPLKANISQ